MVINDSFIVLLNCLKRKKFLEENSNRMNKSHINNLSTGKVAVFPQGYIHYEQNLGCKPAKFISALNHEDPGLYNSSIVLHK